MKFFKRISKFSNMLIRLRFKEFYQDILEYLSDKQSIKYNEQSYQLHQQYRKLFANGICLSDSVSNLQDMVISCGVNLNKNGVLVCNLNDSLSYQSVPKIIIINEDSNILINKNNAVLFYWVYKADHINKLLSFGVPQAKIFWLNSKDLIFSISRFFLSVDLISFDAFTEVNYSHNPFVKSRFLCLSLPEYVGRRQSFIQKNSSIIDDMNIQFFMGLRHTIGWVGCGLSYKYLAYKAKQFDLESFIVCEDDVIFKDDFKQIFSNVLEMLSNQSSYDVYSGFMVDIPKHIYYEKINHKGDNFIKFKYLVSTVFNLYHRSIFDKILAWNNKDLNKHSNTIDVYLGKVVNSVVLSCNYPVMLNSDTSSTLWSGIDKVYRIKSIEAQKQLNNLFNKY